MHKTPTEDPMWLKWEAMAPVLNDKVQYDTNSLITWINRHGHTCLEKKFTSKTHFGKVLEIGAGTGEHLQHVTHQYDTYHLTDINTAYLEKAKARYIENDKVIIEKQSALSLEYADNSFDRLISIYTLEHIPNPHLALEEWRRVVKPGGIISISLPTEGGVAWNLGRYLTTRRYFKIVGLDLDYLIAREHINACYRLVNLINYYFKDKETFWFPFKVPSVNFNLVYACNIVNRK